eukprot:gene13759-biopygen17043
MQQNPRALPWPQKQKGRAAAPPLERGGMAVVHRPGRSRPPRKTAPARARAQHTAARARTRAQ